MNELTAWVLACLAGGALGTLFFGGLWWTVQRSVSSQRPALLFLGSFVLRMSTTVAGFYFVSGGRWQRLLLCLLGFLVARETVKALTRSPAKNPPTPSREASHAP